MRKYFLQAMVFIIVCIASGIDSDGYGQTASNDHIFAPAAAAKPYIDFDSRGFIINGKRTFLVSAGLEYARIPHELWHDRLLRLKRAGFNCVEIYTFWNFHEPEEGKFDFSGDHDLNAFLQEVHKLDMYAIVRVGPYYCAEWDLGGYPHWLRYKTGVIVRSPDAEFEKYMDRFFARLIPVVAKNQINHGGAVVLVQLENEHPLSWGTYIPNEYFAHLQKTALALGLEVPYFFSGLHHGSDPAGNKADLDDPGRPNPWFTTEFWSVWYNRYGSNQRDADEYGQRTWKIIAHGGNGYNYYMAHGGTNFGYTNGHEDAASYDYGAAVGQTGDLRPIYYQFKRNALFARSFQNILENSRGIDNPSQNFTTNDSIMVNTRGSEAGDITFLENPDSVSKKTQVTIEGQLLPSNGPLTLGRWDFIPVVHNFSLTSAISINWSVARILGIQQQGNTKTVVVYGPSGSAGEMWFSVKGNPVINNGNNAFSKHNNLLKLKWIFNTGKPEVYSFTDGNSVVRILALNMEFSDHTWFIDDQGQHKIIVGPQYVGDVLARHDPYQFETEQFWDRGDIDKQVWVYGDNNTVKVLQNNFPATGHTAALTLSPWQVKDASRPAQPGFDDSRWLASNNPLEMGADGDLSEDAWYRASFDVQKEGWYKLDIDDGGNRFIVFVDGKRVAAGALNDLAFTAAAGHHQLVIYAAHDGRDKLYSFTGRLSDVDIKGIAGNVFLHPGKAARITEWKMQRAQQQDVDKPLPAMDSAIDYVIGKRSFRQRRSTYAWFQAVIPNQGGEVPAALYFGRVSKGWTVFVNGKKVAVSDSPDTVLSVPVVPGKNPNQPDMVTIFIANRNGRSGLFRPVSVIYKNDIPLKNWKMKGGPGDFTSSDGWENLHQKDTLDRPAFFRSNFEIRSLNVNEHPVWRISAEGLSHGFVWVNGHNLGAYPERVPINSLYIPEPWLREGANEVVIYDEYGSKPGNVKIEVEKASSRDVHVLTL